MDILTTYRTDNSGKGKVTAKTRGKQRTITYDHERSPAQNHGDAAGILANAAGKTATDGIWATAEDQGAGRWRFTL
jgi:hypothetical protein